MNDFFAVSGAAFPGLLFFHDPIAQRIVRHKLNEVDLIDCNFSSVLNQFNGVAAQSIQVDCKSIRSLWY